VTALPSLEAVLAGSDVVSLHVPLSGATRGLIGAAQLAQMRAGAVLVNMARGGVVDEQGVCVCTALAGLLEVGCVSGAVA
jgi:phosphoglycerate dehydrogenase-like enzyme